MENVLTAEQRRAYEALRKEFTRPTIWDYLSLASFVVFVFWLFLKLEGLI